MSTPPSLLPLRIVWGSLLASIVLYVFILGAGLAGFPKAPLGPDLTLPLAFVALTCAGMSVVVPRFVYRQVVSKAEVGIVDEPAPHASSSEYRRAVPARKIFADPSAARRAAARCFVQPFIVGLALSESVAILGFVAGALGYGMTTAAPYFAVGFLLIAARFPTDRRVFDPFEKALGVSFDPPSR